MKRKFQVSIETTSRDRPRDFEISAALILAEYFLSDVVFLRPRYMKSPDLVINGEIWELKSPIGNSKNTIMNNFKNARKQSMNIIIDLRRCKLDERVAKARIKYIIKNRRHKKGKVLVISKKGEVLDFS